MGKRMKVAKLAKLKAKLRQRTVRLKFKLKKKTNATPAARKVKRLERRQARLVREKARAAHRYLRRRLRMARRKVRYQRKQANRVIRDNGRRAVRVLRKAAQARRGTTQAGTWISNSQTPVLSTEQQQAVRVAYAVAAGRRAAKMAWQKVMRKMDASTARRERYSVSSSTRSVAATTAMKALVH